MRTLLPALRTAAVAASIAAAVAGGSAVAAATAPTPAVSLPPTSQEVASAPTGARLVYGGWSDTGSAALDWMTIFLGLPTGSLQKPCTNILGCPAM